jgi:hypothetical protein
MFAAFNMTIYGMPGMSAGRGLVHLVVVEASRDRA